MTFLRDGGEALLERLYFYGKFLLVAEIYFTVFFSHNGFIPETFFETIKMF
jgi:hypothetical protein